MNRRTTLAMVLTTGLLLAAVGRGAERSGSAGEVPADGAFSPFFDLDARYSPCDDFYQYVNAKWLAANPIPADRTSWGATFMMREISLGQQHGILEEAARNAGRAKHGSIEQKIGWLYASGMDEAAIDRAGVDPIKPKLRVIEALASHADIVRFIDSSFNQGAPYVFEFKSGADWHNARVQIGYVTQAGLGLPTRDYYFQPRYQQVRQAYLAYIAKSLELTGTLRPAAERQAREVLALETAFATASLTPTEVRSLDNQYHFVTVAQADQVSPHFSWEAFFTAQGVEIEKGFSLSQPRFIREFDRQLAQAPLSEWKAYLRFHTVSDASPYLNDALRRSYFEFYGRTLTGQPREEPRWNEVLDAVNDSMGMGLGELYVARYFPPETKARVEQLVANVRAALKRRIQNADWMGDATKAKAIDKWNLFLAKVGYPDRDEWRDWSGLTITRDDYFENIQAARAYDYHYDVGKIGKPTDRREWSMTPQTVDAYYDPTTNTINFPAAFLQPPKFFARGDDAINYGGIGAVIGHEASHAFDDRGSQYDGYGNRENWWTREDRARFDALTKRLIEQFDAYTPIKDRPDLHVNGQLTVGENIADLGGVNVSYEALHGVLERNAREAGEQIQGLTQDQRFFMSWTRGLSGSTREKAAELLLNTDQHAPRSVRAVAPLTNMPQFARAFRCGPGAKMVRDMPVKIW